MNSPRALSGPSDRKRLRQKVGLCFFFLVRQICKRGSGLLVTILTYFWHGQDAFVQSLRSCQKNARVTKLAGWWDELIVRVFVNKFCGPHMRTGHILTIVHAECWCEAIRVPDSLFTGLSTLNNDKIFTSLPNVTRNHFFSPVCLCRTLRRSMLEQLPLRKMGWELSFVWEIGINVPMSCSSLEAVSDIPEQDRLHTYTWKSHRSLRPLFIVQLLRDLLHKSSLWSVSNFSLISDYSESGWPIPRFTRIGHRLL